MKQHTQLPSGTIDMSGLTVTDAGGAIAVTGTVRVNGIDHTVDGSFTVAEAMQVGVTAAGTLSTDMGDFFATIAWVDHAGEVNAIVHPAPPPEPEVTEADPAARPQ